MLNIQRKISRNLPAKILSSVKAAPIAITAELVTYDEYAGTNDVYQIRLLTNAINPNNNPQQDTFLQ